MIFPRGCVEIPISEFVVHRGVDDDGCWVDRRLRLNSGAIDSTRRAASVDHSSRSPPQAGSQ